MTGYFKHIIGKKLFYWS